MCLVKGFCILDRMYIWKVDDFNDIVLINIKMEDWCLEIEKM